MTARENDKLHSNCLKKMKRPPQTRRHCCGNICQFQCFPKYFPVLPTHAIFVSLRRSPSTTQAKYLWALVNCDHFTVADAKFAPKCNTNVFWFFFRSETLCFHGKCCVHAHTNKPFWKQCFLVWKRWKDWMNSEVTEISVQCNARKG